MKHSAATAALILGLVLGLAAGPVPDQAGFKIPFEFEAGGKKYPKGDYTVGLTAEGQILLRQVSTGKESLIPVLNKLAQPETSPAEPRLVFDAVGNFEPSYTEYFTIYILAEVWLPGQDGLEIHVTKGAHETKIVKAEPEK